MASDCSPALDRAFGPIVACRDFDFTLSFEQSILDVGVSSLFLVLLPFCLLMRLRTSRNSSRAPFFAVKAVLSISSAALRLVCLVLWSRAPVTAYSIAASSITLVTSIGIVFLLLVEQQRLIRPSSFISIYLLSRVIADSVQLRTLLLRGYADTIAWVLLAEIVVQAVFLFLESWPRREYIEGSKEYSPEDAAGIFNRSALWWINPLFWLGNRAILKQSDLFTLDAGIRSSHLRNRVDPIWEKNKTKKHPLVRTLLRALFIPWLQTVPPQACTIALQYSQTFLLNDAVSYLAKPPILRKKNDAYGLIGAAFLVYFGMAISKANSQGKTNRMLTIYRGSTISLIYNQSLRYPAVETDLPAVTLMSSDVDQISSAIMFGSNIWANVVTIGIGIWLVWRQLGPIALAPILVAVVCSGGSVWIGKTQGVYRGIWVQALQRRIGFTARALGSMKGIKMSGMVETSARLLQAERTRELAKAKDFRWSTVLQNSIANFPTLIAPLVLFAAYAAQAHLGKAPPLTAAKAFTSLALIQLMIGPSTQLMQGLINMLGASGCISRMQKFLLESTTDERKDDKDLEKNGMIVVDEVVLGLPCEREVIPICLMVAEGEVIMISGTVGSGKSTLLKVLLGERNPKSGNVSLSTSRIGYCAPKPWLRNDTIRNNVTSSNAWDEVWYKTALRVCDLETDLAQMPAGDESLVGSRGVNLSGGQKCRIALARALYARCPLLLLDDPFSSLDRRTRKNVAERLFGGEGIVRKYSITVVFVSHENGMARFADQVLTLAEGGSMVGFVSAAEWISSHPLQDEELDEEEESYKPELINDSPPKPVKKPQEHDESEQIKRQVGDGTVWAYYAKSAGVIPILLLMVFTAAATIGNGFPRIWLKDSTDANQPSLRVFIGVYAAATFTAIVFMVLMLWQILVFVAPKSASVLHQTLVTTTFNAPMSYFEATENSVILNRFSQDMTLIDFQLPMSAWLMLMTTFTLIIELALICLGSSYIAATIPITFFVVFWIQKFYLRTSRQVRFLDLESKSPLYKQFTETIEGLATIRGFGIQNAFQDEFLAQLDESQKAFYIMMTIQRWLLLVLDGTVSGMTVVLVTIALLVPSSSSAGGLGVALTSVLSFNQNLQQLIVSWTAVETSLGSVARTKSFEETTPNENEGELEKLPDKSWPSGKMEVKGLRIQYVEDTVALKDLNFVIEPGQKLGICGRTGSGKSTFLSVLLRLLDPTDGTILIDNIDITTLPRNFVRERLICLPQDPLLMSGTFEFNLNPQAHPMPQSDLSSALQQVGLLDLVLKRGGLQTHFEPESLSHGEQQLLALARAIVRKRVAGGRCVLVLDEATSNLDAVTEAVVRDVVGKEFKECTVVSVAHRLDMLRGCDLVLVLANGEVVRSGRAEEVIDGVSDVLLEGDDGKIREEMKGVLQSSEE